MPPPRLSPPSASTPPSPAPSPVKSSSTTTQLNQRTVGNVSTLNVQGETTNAAGQLPRRVVDASGAVIELTLDGAGRVVNSRVVSQATGRP